MGGQFRWRYARADPQFCHPDAHPRVCPARSNGHAHTRAHAHARPNQHAGSHTHTHAYPHAPAYIGAYGHTGYNTPRCS